MNFATAFYLSVKTKSSFKRASHHFDIAYIPETGELETGYHSEIYHPSAEDLAAQDWIVNPSTITYSDCSIPTSYCSNCSCGKKEALEGK